MLQRKEYTTKPLLVKETADITEYPDPIEVLPEDQHLDLVISDLHGNTLKALYLLIKHGIAEVSRENYAKLVQIYGFFDSLNDKERKGYINRNKIQFMNIISDITFQANARVIFIGDETCDRGALDFLTLFVFDAMHKNDVSFDIILSNHGFDFIRAYEKIRQGKAREFELQTLNKWHACSMVRLQKLINKGCIEMSWTMRLIEEAYKPHLKAVSYSLDESANSIVIYTHAASSLAGVCCLADKLGIKAQYNTARDIASIIDAINVKISELAQNNTLSTLCDPKVLQDGYDANFVSVVVNPLEFLMWNREYEQLWRRDTINDLKLTFVHGHDKDDPLANAPHVMVVDDDFGKAHRPEHYRKEYHVLKVVHQPKKRLALSASDDESFHHKALFKKPRRSRSQPNIGKENCPESDRSSLTRSQ